ncbi:hypothetical protein BJY00DRAFT_297315 [Aspergillus carlsbadensis]|nr:hypothetical protein BJY00DRAFT_297315 [Aspergillus carlsbadensis]
MKKRGVRPNEFSYTIMLDGFKNNEPKPGFFPVLLALRLYRQLRLPSSVVKPNIIITNAMLSVCARHTQLDSIWEIAGELPEEGPGSPDDITYTIILNAIRGSLQQDLAHLRVNDELKIHRRRLLALTEGKRVWTDVVYRWKQGQIEMKNQLVSAMASLLLEGPMDRHMHEIFYLYHQTAGIPILSGKPSHVPSQRSKAFRSQAVQSSEAVPFVNDSGDYLSLGKDIEPEELAEVEAEEQNSFKDIFIPVVSPDAQPYSLECSIPSDAPSTGPKYIPLTPADLSLIMRAALLTQEWGATGKAYWNHLTLENVPYRVTPDEECYKAYLRILRISRSSRMAVEVIRSQILPSGVVEGIYFHIAMGVCRRDRNNYMIFQHASDILSMMNRHLILPDTRAIIGYFDLIHYLEATPEALLDLEDLDSIKRGKSKGLLRADISNFYSEQVRELQVALQLLAIEKLQPFIASFQAALDGVIDGPPELFRQPGADHAPRVRDGPMGYNVITILTRMRQMIDNILKYQAPGQVSEEACDKLKKQSLALRKYSKIEVLERYRNRIIYPTNEQRREFAQHKAEAEARKRRDAGIDTAELGSEESPSELPPSKVPESQLPASPSEDPSAQESVAEAPQSQVSQSQETQPREIQTDESQLENSQPEKAKVENFQDIQWEQILSRENKAEKTAKSEMPQPQEAQSQDPLPQEIQTEELGPREQPHESPSETSPQEAQSQDPLPQEIQTEELGPRDQPRDSISETAPPQETYVEESLSQESHSQEPQSDETQAKESRSDK